jgi:hypothetical protein
MHGGLCLSEREEMIKGRQMSQAIISWVMSNYEIERVSISTFYWSYLAYQAHAICYAKKFGDASHAYCYTGIPIAEKVQDLIEESFQGMENFWDKWESLAGVEPETFAWPKDDPLVVKVRNPRVQGMSIATLASERNSHVNFS